MLFCAPGPIVKRGLHMQAIFDQRAPGKKKPDLSSDASIGIFP